MDAVVHIGMDLAWGPRNKTGVAAVSADGALIASATLHSDGEIVAWIEQHARRTGVVAIDAPLIVTNADGSRPCEKAIHAAFGRFEAAGYPSNLGNPHFDPPRALTLAKRLGLSIDPALPGREHVAIEVYPHPAMVGLFELGRTLKYKRKKQGFEVQHADTLRLLDAMETLAPLRLDASPRWAATRAGVEGATGPGAMGRVEDEIDGIFCAHLAWLWAQRSGTLVVYGDVATGYIVAPPAPTHSPTPRAARAPVALRDEVEDVVMTDPTPTNATPSRRTPADTDAMWHRLDGILRSIPSGKWTTYGVVARVLGSHARPVSQRIASTWPGSYWRVLAADGTVPPGFRWDDGSTDAERSVLERLRSEGVATTADRAHTSARIDAPVLATLIPHL